MIHEKQNSILTFWFGDDTFHQASRMKMWFAKNETFDDEIRQRFEPLIKEAALGAFNDWVKTARGALALVLLLDQFPRNIYRNGEEAFATDGLALRASEIALAHGFDNELSITERMFLYLPFEHTENLAHQARSIQLFTKLFGDADVSELEVAKQALDYAKKHFEIIAEFGRFPQRNGAVGRESTREETAFLNRPGSSF